MRRARGFALAELIVALVIAGIIGVALTKLVINQSRFVATQDGIMRARSGARSALNLVMSELRTVGDSSVMAAGPDSLSVRVPYVHGIACAYSAGRTIIGLLPADSAQYAGSTARGTAWRDSLGTWRFIDPITVTTGAPVDACWTQTPVISLQGNANWTQTAIYVNSTTPALFSPMYLYQLVTYSFAPSVDMPGRRALWRRVMPANVREEMVAPFDTSSHFEFIVGGALAVQATPPLSLDSIMGVRVKLIAASDNTPQGRAGPLTFDLTTKLLFRNHAP